MKNRLLLTSSLIFIVIVGISFFKLDLNNPNFYKFIFAAGFGLAVLNAIFIFLNRKGHTALTRWLSIILVLCYLLVFIISLKPLLVA